MQELDQGSGMDVAADNVADRVAQYRKALDEERAARARASAEERRSVELVELAARTLFERRPAHAGLRFDALPMWAQWVRESYLEDARAVLVAIGALAPDEAARRDPYERLALAATGSAQPVAISPRGPAQSGTSRPAMPTEVPDVFVLSEQDVQDLGRTAVVQSLAWHPGSADR